MRPLRAILVLCAAIGLWMVGAGTAAGQERPPVRGVVLQGTVDPASAQFITRRLKDADREGAAVFVIQMDTPGGLVTSMHDIVRAMESASTPTVVWVGPAGSRAGSAGAYISAASDLLLMAPGTNIGSATPVSGAGEDLDAKIVNDAAAQIAALAEAHGRNAAAYRAMVTDQKNFPASEAVAQKIAEGQAVDRATMVRELDRRRIDGRTVRTAGADVRFDEMPWYLRLIQVLIDPNLLSLFFGLGIAAIGWEIFHPGAIVPGVTGAVFLLIAALGLSLVPFNWAGLALIGLAFVLFALEATVAGVGFLAVGGIVSLVVGGLVLFDDAEGPVVSRPGLIIASIALGVAFTLLARAAWRARRAPRTTGRTSLTGHTAVVRREVHGETGGQVFLDGELWSARTDDGARIPIGRDVRVTAMHDLTLSVEALPEDTPP